MGRRLDTFRKTWCIWVVLFFSIGIKSLVNQVEGPFARSLVVCDDSFMRPQVYTGSRWCGDRLEVIQGGVLIQSLGQSQENLAMLCSLTFVVVITGVWGPKVALVLGLVGVTISVALFLMACSSPELGRSLYAIAQGLQGVYPIEYLQGVIMLHLSWLPDTDPQATFEFGSYMGILTNLVWVVGLGNVVSLLEISDYTRIWGATLTLNVVVLVTALARFPAMRPPDLQKNSEQGPFAKVFSEVLSYKDLLLDWRPRRLLVKLIFENMQRPYFTVSLPAMMMAYHGWSQSSLTWIFFVKDLFSLACIPLFQKLLNSFGHHTTYVWSCRWLILSVALRALTLPFTDKIMILVVYGNELISGFGAFRGFVDSRFAEPDQMQRFQSVQWLLDYFEGIWVIPLYASMFDAFADTYAGRVRPGLLCSLAVVIHYWTVFHYIYDMDGVHGFGVTLRVLDEGGSKCAQLWDMVAGEDGWISYEKFQLYNLEGILGLPWMYTGGEGIFSREHWMGLMAGLNGTPQQGQETTKRLDVAIAHAHGVHESFRKAVSAQEEKATVLWHMVAGEDGWIDHEKRQVYELDSILGAQWSGDWETVSSQEQWLALFDPFKVSEDSLGRLDWSIAHAEGVHRAFAQVTEESWGAVDGSSLEASSELAHAEAAWAGPADGVGWLPGAEVAWTPQSDTAAAELGALPAAVCVEDERGGGWGAEDGSNVEAGRARALPLGDRSHEGARAEAAWEDPAEGVGWFPGAEVAWIRQSDTAAAESGALLSAVCGEDEQGGVGEPTQTQGQDHWEHQMEPKSTWACPEEHQFDPLHGHGTAMVTHLGDEDTLICEVNAMAEEILAAKSLLAVDPQPASEGKKHV